MIVRYSFEKCFNNKYHIGGGWHNTASLYLWYPLVTARTHFILLNLVMWLA